MIPLNTMEALLVVPRLVVTTGLGLTISRVLHMGVSQQATPHLVTLIPGYFLPQVSVSSLEQAFCKETCGAKRYCLIPQNGG